MEKNIENEYYPPDKDLPSIKIALEHARCLYNECLGAKQGLETKGTLIASISIAMIGILSVMDGNFILPTLIFVIALVISVVPFMPISWPILYPDEDEFYILARHNEEKSMDLILISHINCIKIMKSNINVLGKLLLISFFMNSFGIGMIISLTIS